MIFKGVYAHIDELPPYEHLDSSAWVHSQIEKLKLIIKNPKEFIKENVKLQSILSSFSNIKVVDYGGSFALGYVALGNPTSIHEYHVIETQAICKAVKDINIGELSGVVFHERSSDIDFNYDLLYSRTALQYSKDWKKELIALLKGSPSKICLAHTSCGDIPTYLTIQNWYGTKIPYWFINQNELINFMNQYEYELIENEQCENIEHLFFNKEGNHDIPLTHVLEFTRNLVFSK